MYSSSYLVSNHRLTWGSWPNCQNNNYDVRECLHQIFLVNIKWVSERCWSRGIECDSLSPFTSMILCLITSKGKCEGICNSLTVPDINVHTLTYNAHSMFTQVNSNIHNAHSMFTHGKCPHSFKHIQCSFKQVQCSHTTMYICSLTQMCTMSTHVQ